MRKLFTILAVVLLTATVWAQSPEKMSYQAVIRDASNNLITNHRVGMQISILDGAIPVYVETQTATTNVNGLVSIEIGAGSVVSGTFATIDWSAGVYSIKTETDPTGGTNYTITGISQLLSVPYAFHSITAETITGGITETDPAFVISPANGITSADIINWNNKLGTEVDGSVTNEIQALSISNDTVYLTNGGFVELPTASSFTGEFLDLLNVPTGLADGDDNTQLNETEVDAFVANNGYLTSEVDGSITNELQVISISNDTVFLSKGGFVKLPAGFSGSFNDLADVPTNLDTDATDDFDGAYSSLSGVPTNVSTFTNDVGYLTAEVDGSTTNEIELPTQTGNSGRYLTTDGSSPSWGTFQVSDNSIDGTDIALGSDAAGDVMYYDGTNWVRLPKGTDGQVLTLSSGVSAWAAASGGSSGLTITTVSSNTTLSTENQFVHITGSYTITLPLSPSNGQILNLLTEDRAAVIDLNGGTVHQSGNDYTDNDPISVYLSSGFYLELLYIGGKWYVLI